MEEKSKSGRVGELLPILIVVVLLVTGFLGWRVWRNASLKGSNEETTVKPDNTNSVDVTEQTDEEAPNEEEDETGPEFFGVTSEKGVVIKLRNIQDGVIKTDGKSISIDGMAPGPWFFEAQARIVLVDKDGKELAIGIISATDWMATEYVDFSGSLDISGVDAVALKDSVVVFERANASGLPEKDDKAVVKVEVR